MLKLRKVELFGFKSFADRTSILFPGSGISAVVGPNGCGKSNVADAILWVLGEQSAKTLRSSRMSDVLFNGTTERPQTNLAEVSLTLVDPEAERAGRVGATPLFSQAGQPTGEAGEESESEAPSPDAQADDKERRNKLGFKLAAGEIVVTRRLYRDGKSEYYLNGDYCRLRDIQELFMGTGLGPQSYAIIEQGRIGQILSSKPTDRRALIEEAAGISKYKTQKRLAEGKLEATRQNLLRVNDILEEVTKQLGSLKRQASRARRYQTLKSESVALRRVLLATQVERLAGREDELAATIEQKAEAYRDLSARLEQAEEKQSSDHSRQFELESRARQEQNRVGEIMVAAERAQAGLTDCRRQQEEIKLQLAALEQDLELCASDAAVNLESVNQARTRESAISAALSEVQSRVDGLTGTADALEQRVQDCEESLRQLEAERTAQIHAEATDRAEMNHSHQALESFREQDARFEAATSELTGEIEAARHAEQAAASQLSAARQETSQAQDWLASASAQVDHLTRERTQLRERVEHVREELSTVSAREKALSDLLAQRKAFAEPVQQLLKPANGHGNGNGNGHLPGGESDSHGFRAVGVVADFAEFDPGYADLLQNYLKEELEYLVVDTYDLARQGVSLLREGRTGHATFLVNSFKRNPVQMPPENQPRPEGEGLIGAVGEFLRLNGSLGEEAKKVLPRLTSTYLVESPVHAESLAARYPRYSFLTTDGTCYQGRLVSGGGAQSYGVFQLQEEAETVAVQRTELEPRVGSLLETLRNTEAALASATAEQEAARARAQEAEKKLVEIEQRHRSASLEQGQAERRLEAHQREQHSLTERMEALRAQLEAAQLRIHESEQKRTALAGRIEEAWQALEQARNQRVNFQPDLTELRSEKTILEDRLLNCRAELSRLEGDRQRLTQNRDAMLANRQRLADRQSALEGQVATLLQEVARLRDERAAQEALCRELDAERDRIRAGLAEQEAQLRQMRRELEELRDRRNAIEIERARLQSDRQHVDDAIQSEFGRTADQLRTEVSDRLEGEALQQAEEQDRELRRKLDNIGPVNMMALEEFDECEQRHDFLTRQREDLLASMEDIRQTIAELDRVAYEKFSQAFETINRNFQETFKTLFNGGQAMLRLTQAEDPSEAGVELICQPPNKRLQNVLLLSGGEKALTALSLLIAIFRYTPSPFCILDEVDAPLDDTNIGRFTRMVQEMSPNTQFILVTHSKKTMESASILYGVTMQSAVSQVVSVRFEEAAKSAA